eukprot:Hpha_TRINITY_DN9127_c0_g1::TRINITY_DN9127_c0_g1_i2::g.94587::m.94587
MDAAAEQARRAATDGLGEAEAVLDREQALLEEATRRAEELIAELQRQESDSRGRRSRLARAEQELCMAEESALKAATVASGAQRQLARTSEVVAERQAVTATAQRSERKASAVRAAAEGDHAVRASLRAAGQRHLKGMSGTDRLKRRAASPGLHASPTRRAADPLNHPIPSPRRPLSARHPLSQSPSRQPASQSPPRRPPSPVRHTRVSPGRQYPAKASRRQSPPPPLDGRM